MNVDASETIKAQESPEVVESIVSGQFPQASWVVATDGSVDQRLGLSTFAWVGEDGTSKVTVEHGLGATLAEVAAIESALKAAPANRKVVLITDSKNSAIALNALMAGRPVRWPSARRNPMVAARWASVEHLIRHRVIEVRWVRAHRGPANVLNRQADHLAKGALRSERLNLNPHSQLAA